MKFYVFKVAEDGNYNIKDALICISCTSQNRVAMVYTLNKDYVVIDETFFDRTVIEKEHIKELQKTIFMPGSYECYCPEYEIKGYDRYKDNRNLATSFPGIRGSYNRFPGECNYTDDENDEEDE